VGRESGGYKVCYEVATISRLLDIIGLFVDYRLFYTALLQKRPTEGKWWIEGLL